MIHIVNLGISEKKNLGRIETELNFYLTKKPKAQKATGWAWLV